MRVGAGTARSIPLKSREGIDTRPTADRVKEAVFNILQFDVPGARVLDLFGGSGQLAIEALSRGAESAVIVDNSPEALSVIRENLERTRLKEHAQTVRADYLEYLDRCRDSFRLIFLDPPYREIFLETALKRISEIDVSAGYDIVSFDSNKSQEPDRFIEVKAISNAGFYWSRNEYEIAKLKGEKYYLYLVELRRVNEPGYTPEMIKDPASNVMGNDGWFVEPESYHIKHV
jgi:16S rRNA (guanine(966)-N(2))-methyltransferase RsmD